MFNRLVLTPNAYFYKVLKPVSKAAINRVFITASIHKKGHLIFSEIRKHRKIGGLNFDLSLIVFKQDMLPSFLKPGTEKDLRHSYLLLVEYDRFFIVSKSGASEFISEIEDKIDYLSYQEIAKFKISAGTKIEKLNVSNLDTASGAMRRSSYEANDVKETLSTIAMGNKIVTGLKIKNQGNDSTLAPGTSRINDLGKRQDLDSFCYWAATQCTSLTKFKHKPGYLDNFAEPLDFQANIKSLKVLSVLFNFSTILEDLNDQSIVGIDYLDSNGRTKDIDLRLLSETHDLCLDIVYEKTTGKYRIQNKHDNSLELKILKNGFRVFSSKLDRIRVHYTTGEITNLLDLIIKENLFILSFDKADIRYSLKTLFRDSKLLKNLSYFLKGFETENALKLITSEKGNCVTTSRNFDKGCLFEIIESKFAGDCDYLFCDDLGDEWADYIGLKRDSFIRFYHAKFSSKGFSASAFHELVSQALKNLGNFNFDQNITAKSKKLNNVYSGTAINRLRKGSSVVSCIRQLQATFNNPKTVKELILVINFLSKKELEDQLVLLTAGKAKNQTVQMLWLLSSLFGTCRDRGIRIRIITKP